MINNTCNTIQKQSPRIRQRFLTFSYVYGSDGSMSSRVHFLKMQIMENRDAEIEFYRTNRCVKCVVLKKYEISEKNNKKNEIMKL